MTGSSQRLNLCGPEIKPGLDADWSSAEEPQRQSVGGRLSPGSSVQTLDPGFMKLTALTAAAAALLDLFFQFW